MLKVAQERIFVVSEREAASLLKPFTPLLPGMTLEEAQRMFGSGITEENREQCLAAEEPFDSDLEALGQLYLDDYEYALRDIYNRRAFTIDDVPEGSSAPTMPSAQHRHQFPGKVLYYSMEPEDYPQLGESLAAAKELRRKRRLAIYAVLLGK